MLYQHNKTFSNTQNACWGVDVLFYQIHNNMNREKTLQTKNNFYDANSVDDDALVLYWYKDDTFTLCKQSMGICASKFKTLSKLKDVFEIPCTCCTRDVFAIIIFLCKCYHMFADGSMPLFEGLVAGMILHFCCTCGLHKAFTSAKLFFCFSCVACTFTKSYSCWEIIHCQVHSQYTYTVYRNLCRRFKGCLVMGFIMPLYLRNIQSVIASSLSCSVHVLCFANYEHACTLGNSL